LPGRPLPAEESPADVAAYLLDGQLPKTGGTMRRAPTRRPRERYPTAETAHGSNGRRARTAHGPNYARPELRTAQTTHGPNGHGAGQNGAGQNDAGPNNAGQNGAEPRRQGRATAVPAVRRLCPAPFSALRSCRLGRAPSGCA
jgi:hypothetical protein